jgi:predicted aldo/keto reductase-like oxidoreductase
VISAEEAIRYVLSLPMAVLVTGIDSIKILRQNLKIASEFSPMPAREMQALREKVRAYAADGRFELYKTSMCYDGPPGREQHGFPPLDEMEA